MTTTAPEETETLNKPKAFQDEGSAELTQAPPPEAEDDEFASFFDAHLEGAFWTVDEMQQLQQMHREGKQKDMLQMKSEKDFELAYPSKGMSLLLLLLLLPLALEPH